MSKDYAANSRSASKTRSTRKTSPTNAKRSPAPKKKRGFWQGFFAGTLLSTLGFGGFHLYTQSPNTAPDSTGRRSTESPSIPKPRFDFYNILKESEVPVEHSEPLAPPPNLAPAPAPTPVTRRPKVSPPPASKPVPSNTKEAAQWALQAGSFRDKSDANQLRARLLLQNFQARIVTVKVSGQGTRHRVMVGPFTTRKRLESTQRQLTRLDIDTIQVRG